MRKIFNVLLSLALLGGFAGGCFGQVSWDDEVTGTTEVTGFYQQYRDFSFVAGGHYDFTPEVMTGGGFTIAHNLADWFALWLQVSIYGKVKQDILSRDIITGEEFLFAPKRVRIVNEIQGIRYQTKQYGPFRLYGKGGLGIVWYNFDVEGGSLGYTKFSALYGGGTDIWLHKNIGITLDISHVMYILPELTGQPGREKVDSGLTYTTGLTFRF